MSEAAKKRETAKRLAKARTQTQENCEEQYTDAEFTRNL